MDFSFLFYSFTQGVLTFFAPCAIALLPGYIAYFLSKKQEKGVTPSKKTLAKNASFLAGYILLGFLTMYLISGVLIFTFSSFVKTWIPRLSFIMGLGFIVLGILSLLGKGWSVSAKLQFKKAKSEFMEGYLFGISYGVAALGCLFPLFLVIVYAALKEPLQLGIIYLTTYFIGMALCMLLAIYASTFARKTVQKNLGKIMKYVPIFTGILLILAGIYIMVYQSSLIF